MSRSVQNWMCVSFLGVLAVCLACAGAAQAALIADWTFDGADWTTNPGGLDGTVADASGNGHGLTWTQVAQSSTTPTGVGSSAHLTGTWAVGMATAAPLDLSAYRQLSISWSQLLTSDAVSLSMEFSPDAMTNPGGFYVSNNEAAGTMGVVLKNNHDWLDSVNAIQAPIAHGESNTTWENFQLDINLDATGTDVLKLTKNGVVVSQYDPMFLRSLGFNNEAAPPASFGNYYFNIGNRQGGINAIYNGYIDNVRLEGTMATPEPSTLAILASAIAGLLAYAWKKRK